MYKAWLVKDPACKSAGKASSMKGTPGVAKPGRPRKAQTAGPATSTPESLEPEMVFGTRLVACEMPLRQDLLVRLTLPIDLTVRTSAVGRHARA